MKGYVFTYLLVGVGVFGAFRSPLIALAVYVALAIIRPHFMWGFAGNMSGLSQWVGIALIAGWVLRGAGSWQFGRGRILVAALLAFAVWATISATMTTLAPTVAWDWTISMWKFVVPFLVGATTIRSPEWVRRMFWVIVISQGYVAYEMNFAYVFDGVNRVRELGYGGMDNNSFGIALVTTLGPTIALLISARAWWAKGIAAVAGLSMLHTILLTFSRGAMIGLIAVAIFAIIILPKRPSYLAVVLIGALVAFRFTGPELMDRFSSAFVEQENLDTSAASRLILWQNCLTVAIANPIFGLGPYQWPYIASSFGWTPLKSAHSVWVQTMAELGFPGVAWLALFFVMSFVRMWPLARSMARDPDSRERAAFATGVMLSAVGFAVSGQFVTLVGLEVPYYIVMVGVGMLAIAPESAFARVKNAVAMAPLPAINLPRRPKPLA
jgi:probable O-glycosylation ligase (exosortase A-associated)